MTTVQFEVQNDLVRMLGLEQIKKYFEAELAYHRFRLLEMQVQAALALAGDVNWDMEFENARQEAFEEYITRRKQAQ